ncbi:hypothetical protein ADEAN_000902900 [Angomonas deanei]|uniref:Uncharacterized protein n=1 Tax=Angomonas deanei TaxID=59799 RepID=A0A7G2CQS9_9TRYP|nr:hypothetical protein ADEAN_000902900 [Angomonas deanei]
MGLPSCTHRRRHLRLQQYAAADPPYNPSPLPEEQEDSRYYTAAELEDLIRRRDAAWEAERRRFHNERELRRKEIEAQRKMLTFEANRYEREASYLTLQTEKEKRKLRELQSALREDVKLGEDLFRSSEYIHHPQYLTN